jgi:hypothetical protein
MLSQQQLQQHQQHQSWLECEQKQNQNQNQQMYNSLHRTDGALLNQYSNIGGHLGGLQVPPPYTCVS